MAVWVRFLFVLWATLALLCAALVVLMARSLLRPRRMTDAKATWLLKRLSPMDLGLEFENITFQVRDERTGNPLRIAAWWIPAASACGRTILLIHGYADAKVGAIAWAPVLHSLGWNILTIDLRGHGESDGVYSTAGYYERRDVDQVISQFRAIHPRETQTLVIFGISLGAAVAVATAVMRDDIAALILESPYADYRRAIAAHGRMRGLPEGLIRESAVHLAEVISAADFHAVRPGLLIKDVKCPVMVIRAGNDPFIPDEDAAAMKEALQARGHALDQHWSVDCAGHVLCIVADPQEYRSRIGGFLDVVTSSSAQPTSQPAA